MMIDKTALIARFSKNDEQKFFLHHLYDLMVRCRDRNVITVGNFMSEAEVALAADFMRACHADSYVSYGGYPDAERRCPIFLPDYLTAEDVEADPSLADMIFIRAEVSRFDAKDADLSHRDVLGALMGLGIERDCIGDILADRSVAVFLVKKSVGDYLRENLIKISRYPIEMTLHDTYDVCPTDDAVEGFDTVASMRLDAVVAAVFSLSRGTATDFVSGGLVSVNGAVMLKGDHTVLEGDKIALRGKGKVVIDRMEGQSKKGRLRFRYRKFR